MTGKKVWFITGAGRGMGVYFAQAALAAGHAVVAAGRNNDAVAKAVGQMDNLLVTKLDVTDRAEAEAAAQAASTSWSTTPATSSRVSFRNSHQSRSNSSWRHSSWAR
jgi:NAD(P)-dependent dehydrogenase (short-subunit alcohol dehydrogenase family)